MQTGSAVSVASRIFLTFVLTSAALDLPIHAQTFKVLHTFHTDEGLYQPFGQLVLDAKGNLYGIAAGGNLCYKKNTCGTAFEMNKSGTLMGVFRFDDGPDGNGPAGGLLRDATGNFFGVTVSGGVNTKACDDDGEGICGVVYKLNAVGKETVLHRFTNTPDGEAPESLLVEDSAGNLYGTTLWGGVNFGTVFKVDQVGNETILYTFTGQADGGNPYAGVILDSSGNLYGTTAYGGNTGCGSISGQGCGAVYQLNPDGQETLLYAFQWGTDGAFPSSGLMEDAAGNLYGEAKLGGNEQVYNCEGYEGCGVVYELAPGAKYTVLYAFNYSDGFLPTGGLVRDTAGNLYGTTEFGGTYSPNCQYGDNCGVVFKLDTAGNETVLHAFSGGTDGAAPDGGLVMDASGNLYGTTESGGDTQCQPTRGGCGVVFEITP
jgi:uncharacterized repeat protein (TIGR03803 family)